MKRSAFPAALVALAAVALTGCTLTGAAGAPPESTPTPTDAVALAGERWSGTGTGAEIRLDYEVPEGAQTMVLKLGCTGEFNSFPAHFDLQIVPLERFRTGTCDGIRQWEFAVPEIKQPLLLSLPADIGYVAELSFRADPPSTDAAIEADCAAYSPIQSAFFNADVGFRNYGLTEQEWRDRITEASRTLESVAADSTSLLSAPLTATSEAVSAEAIAPGGLMSVAGYWDAHQLIASICVNNDTQLITFGEFGG